MPKPGIVIPKMFSTGLLRSFIASTLTRSASVLSRPPLIPITHPCDDTCSSLFASPLDCIAKISSHLSLISSLFDGINGYASTYLNFKSLSSLKTLIAENPISLEILLKDVSFCLIVFSFSMSTSAMIISFSRLNLLPLASIVPFSQISVAPLKTRSVVLSVTPALE